MNDIYCGLSKSGAKTNNLGNGHFSVNLAEDPYGL